ncbi:MAG: hypothetical protein GTN86_11995 [Xanthomonadales bacterium]|nr:hypothetical protein [Xanthomonadales bacterium]NIN60436.1 hypothetical protein [Xanthomonadales bacterium]NIN75789.1 hypothetical protein [Xanthomonadales bacterium]NIO12967.1 hypothetical protein [Xanthomonadales bacterium]NIP12829.1 hypothetical protein [Xanthomonadales bacterium]
MECYVMEDVIEEVKAPKPQTGQANPHGPETADRDRPAAPETAQAGRRTETLSTEDRAQDRWFMEDRGNRRVPKRLDVPNEALVSAAGPLKLTGNITLIDEAGQTHYANHLTLCRCGASRNKPYCDDQHMEVEFFDSGSIPQASECRQMANPQMLTVTCIKDGPLKYQGYLRVYNRKGQQCLTMQGALCRCGRSTKKPFCDCR